MIRIIKSEIIGLTEAGILVLCIAMFYVNVLGLNISWWFVLLPMIIVVLYIILTAS